MPESIRIWGVPKVPAATMTSAEAPTRMILPRRHSSMPVAWSFSTRTRSTLERLIKAPKLYWCDTALALHLTGESELRGAHLENLVLMDLLAWRDTQARKPEVLYWRTATGEEVDLVIETPSRTIPIERATRGTHPHPRVAEPSAT